MRHAKSSWKDGSLSDHERPLNKRGRRDAPRMARMLERLGWIPSDAVVSTSVRTRETIELMLNELKATTIEYYSDLYHPNVPVLQGYVDRIIEGKTMLILTHNPACELIIEALSGLDIVMPTAAIALFEKDDQGWALIKVLRPKEI